MARTAHAGLNLIEDQQHAMAVASLAQAAQALVGHGPHTALALDGFDQHGGAILARHRRIERVMIAEGNHSKPGAGGPKPSR
jgi:hypothetical protein